MDYKTLCLIKDAVDTFNDSEFVSVLDESRVAVKNNLTGDIWKIGYFFEEDKLFFSTESAVVLEENEQIAIDPMSEIKKAFAHSLIAESDAGIDYIKEVLEDEEAELFNRKSIVSESFEDESSDEIMVFKEDVDYSPSERAKIVEIANRWEEKSDAYEESRKQFLKAGFLFEGSSIRSDERIENPLDLIQTLRDKKSAVENAVINQQVLADFHEALEEIMGDAELSQAATAGVDFSADRAKIETALTKNLVIAKRDFNEDFNVREKVKEILALGDQIVLESVGQGIYSNENRYSYLKPSAGFWTRRDLNALMVDFDQVLGNFVNMTRDEQMAIQEMKDTIDHMYRTNQIVDDVVHNVIQSFNEMYFVKAQSDKDALFDASKSGPDTTGRHLKAYHRAIAPGSV